VAHKVSSGKRATAIGPSQPLIPCRRVNHHLRAVPTARAPRAAGRASTSSFVSFDERGMFDGALPSTARATSPRTIQRPSSRQATPTAVTFPVGMGPRSASNSRHGRPLRSLNVAATTSEPAYAVVRVAMGLPVGVLSSRAARAVFCTTGPTAMDAAGIVYKPRRRKPPPKPISSARHAAMSA
jgi:hypothetical protein